MKFLSGRKIKLTLITMALVTSLSGCVGLAQEINTSLSDLALEGELMVFNPEDLQPEELELTTVTTRDLIQRREIPVSMDFPYTVNIHFERAPGGNIDRITWYYGRYEGDEFREGQWINEGDFIAELFYETPESLSIERDSLLMERQEYEREIAQEQNRRLVQIESYRMELEFVYGMEWELTALRLREHELEYENFLLDVARRREDFDRRLERIEEPIQGERLYSPMDGFITWVNPGIGNTGTNLFRSRNMSFWGGIGHRVISILDSSKFVFNISAPLYVVRFGDVMAVRPMQGEMSFNMQVVTDPMTRPVSRDGFFDFQLAPVCMDEFHATLEEHDLTIYDLHGILLRAQAVLPLALDATVVHQLAVAEEGPRSYVLLYEDGAISKRYVLVGSSLDNHVQILAGLSPGQRVVMP